MNTETKVYSVSKRTNKWTNEPASIQWYLDKGAKVSPARLHGDYTLWVDGRNVGALFVSQKEQISFLREHGMLN